jgi:hypothetical protein
MSIQIKYAYRRHNTWTYRRTYPQHLRGILGSSLKQSLRTSDAKIARKRVDELNTKFTDIVQEAEDHAAAIDTCGIRRNQNRFVHKGAPEHAS